MITETNAEKAIEELKAYEADVATALRDGRWTVLPAAGGCSRVQHTWAAAWLCGVGGKVQVWAASSFSISNWQVHSLSPSQMLPRCRRAGAWRPH